ncbi:MAG: cyclic nucleotide-binding domain-containing protein [Candidatus Binataceae bacterium]
MPKLKVLMALLAPAFLCAQARHSHFNFAAEKLYVQNDPNNQYDMPIRARFGSEVGNEMFVLNGGRAELRVALISQSRIVRQVTRGEVFGKMGLIRHHDRMADIIANDDVEVLVVNERFPTRDQRRYPRIGAKIFLECCQNPRQPPKAGEHPHSMTVASAADF